MKTKVSFAQIDARDCETGYDPVGFLTEKYQRLYPRNKEGLILQTRMIREYLVAIGKVQEDIAAKYREQATDELFTKVWEDSYDYTNTLSIEEEQAIRNEFPGTPAEYYD